ncbi:MAG TPA: Fic family protein, partial [Cytophagaceae bacterium]
AGEIKDPFEQALFVMVQLPYLQPFDDVNKRVSRLATNISLNKKNLAPLSFTEVPGDMYVKGLLGVYELNKVDLLKEVFIWAYESSAKQYALHRQTLGDPDPFRLQHREMIKNTVAEIIRKALNKNKAIALIKSISKELTAGEQLKFIETVEQELLNLHEGNFARFLVSPAEFGNWSKIWEE